jgi:hypothetical protein
MTRFYLEGSDYGTPGITPAFDAAWGDTEDAIRRWLSSVASSTAMISVAGDEAVSTSPLDVLVAQFVSEPLAAQTISGTVKGQIRASESNADADYRAQIVIRVVSNDGTTVIGTLLAADASALSSEFATTLTNRKFPLAASSPAALTSTAVSAGDRLVVEIGFRSHNAHTTSRSGTIRIGSAATTDLAEDESTTADDRPWIELSGTITFDNGARRISEVAPLVAGTEAPERRVSAIVPEIAGTKAPERRVSELAVLVAGNVDLGGWDILLDDYTNAGTLAGQAD